MRNAVRVSLLGLFAVTAGDAATPYKVAGMPFQIANPSGVTPTVKLSADGKTLEFKESLTVKPDAATNTHTVTLTAHHQPTSLGGRLSLSVFDQQAASTTVYAYDPTLNTLSLTTGTDVSRLVHNPDGSYTVDGITAANGKTAMGMLRAKAAYTKASRHGVLAAYASAQTPVPVVRSAVDCSGTPSTTPGVAICTTFKDLCDCAACDASGIWGACAACP